MKVGVMLLFGEDEAPHQSPCPSRPQLCELVVTAEEAGLDSIYGADHVIFHGDRTRGSARADRADGGRRGHQPRRGRPARAGAPFRNPALTAKMAVELDEVSGGRLVLGLGCGWHEPEFRDFDFPFDHRVGRFEEALQIILPLLREGRVRFEGRWHRADTELCPARRGPAARRF